MEDGMLWQDYLFITVISSEISKQMKNCISNTCRKIHCHSNKSRRGKKKRKWSSTKYSLLRSLKPPANLFITLLLLFFVVVFIHTHLLTFVFFFTIIIVFVIVYYYCYSYSPLKMLISFFSI